MAVIGTVREIWRYPVKSMGGGQLDRCTIGPRGITGDRGWAVKDEKAGEIRSGRKLHDLIRCSAAYVSEPVGEQIPPAIIKLPDGNTVRSDTPEAALRVSELCGRTLSLWPLQPPTALKHYERARPDNPDMVAELRELFGRLENEPLPDLSVFPPELIRYVSPLGTYFDAFPIHALTTASLDELHRRNPGAKFDVRRFRPNIVIETSPALRGFVEAGWNGKTLSLGGVRLKAEFGAVRCVMTTLPQGELPKDPSVLRTVVKEAAQNVGSYLSVLAGGAVAVGDTVELE